MNDGMDGWRFARAVWLLMNDDEVGEWDDETVASTDSEESDDGSIGCVAVSDDEDGFSEFGSEIELDENFELTDVTEESGEVVYVLSFSLGGGTHELLVYDEPDKQ